MLLRKAGSVNGSPWIGKTPMPVTHCKIVYPTNGHVEIKARMIKTTDLNLGALETGTEEDVDLNMAIIESLGRDEWSTNTEEHSLYILIWASTVSSTTTQMLEPIPMNMDHITVACQFEDVGNGTKIAFDAQFLVSQFSVDVKQLDFGDCSGAEQIVREFTIKNLRDTKLLYRIDIYRDDNDEDTDFDNTSAAAAATPPPQLALAWYETGEAITIGALQTLSGKSFARIHATLRSVLTDKPGAAASSSTSALPTAVFAPKFKWTVCLENERNSENVSNISVTATRAEMPAAPIATATTTPNPPSTTMTNILEILHEISRTPLGSLNFGDDCVVGNVASRKVILKNTGTVAMEVSLSSPDAAVCGAVSMIGADMPEMDKHEESEEEDSDENDPRGETPRPRSGTLEDTVEQLSPPPPHHTPLQEEMDDSRTLSPPPNDDYLVGGGADRPARRGSHSNLQTACGSITTLNSSSPNYAPAARPPSAHLPLASISLSMPASTFIRLNPGEEKNVKISYLPQGVAGGLKTPIVFRLAFSCMATKQLTQQLIFKRTVMAECKACLSLFSVSPTLIKFGDCLLNQPKTSQLVFTNLSEVETIVRPKFESRVMRIDPAIITIEPKGKATATLTFVPKRTNPRYYKEFTCINPKNKKNTMTVRFESHNIDTNSFPYHTYFYNLVAFNKLGQEEDFTNWPAFFGPTLLDGVNARRIGIRNLTKRELVLNFKCSTDELQVLAPQVDAQQQQDSAQSEFARVMEEFELGRFASTPSSAAAVVGKPHPQVDKQVEHRLNFLSTKLRKVSSVTLPPESENKLVILVLVFRPNSTKRPNVSGALKFDSSLSLTIDLPNLLAEDLKFLQDALLWNLGEKEDIAKATTRVSPLASTGSYTALNMLPESTTSPTEDKPQLLSFFTSRTMTLRTMVAKAEMNVSQSHFNHGLVDNSWERRPFKVVLNNISGEPLVFKIERKTRELLPIKPGATPQQQQQQTNASCVEIEDSKNCGVVPAYSSETINMLFVPKIWAGRVKETLLIKNVMVPSSTVEIVVKAVVSLPEHFRVEHEELDFGPIFPGITGETTQLLTLFNTSDKTRDLTLQVSKENSDKWPKAYLAVFCFYVFPPQIEGAPTTLATVQEQIEEIEFKARLAVRKNDTEKIAILNRKLQSLQAQQPKEAAGGSFNNHTRGLVFGPLKGSRRVALPPKSSVQVAMKLHVRLMASFATYQGPVSHSVKVFETRQENKGPMKHIPFSCKLFDDRQSFFKATTPRSSSLGSSPVIPSSSPYALPSNTAASMQHRSSTLRIATPIVPFSLDPDQPVPIPVRQIEVGARNLNTWFTFVLPRGTGEAGAILSSPRSPKVYPNAAAATAAMTASVSVDLGKFRVVFGNEDQRASIEMKPIVVESYRELIIHARYLKGGRHLIALCFESLNTPERHDVLVKGQASYLEMLPSALDFGNLIVVPEEPTKPHHPYFSSKPLLKSQRSFTVTNTHKEPVFVTAESNSNFFVLYLSQDESKIDRIMLEPGQEMKMFVAIKPALLADAWRGVCRVWKGGIVVTCEVGSEDDRDMETHHVARFQSLLSLTANVGMSLFSVGEQRVAGALTVRNESEKIPLHIECSAMEPHILFTCTKLEIPPLSECDVLFSTLTQEATLCFCTIVVRNTDSGEVKRLANSACVYKSDILRLEKVLDFRVAVPVRRKNDLCVVAHDAVGADPVRVRNMSANRIRMVMSCRLLTSATQQQPQDPPLIGGNAVFALSSSQPPTIKDFVPRAQCVLGAGAAKDILYRFPRDSKLLPDSFQGWLAFELRIADVPTVLAAVRFRGEARISQFEVVSGLKQISAGEVGVSNMWRKEATLCKLVNPDPFVPAEVEISITSPIKALILTPLNPRLFLEPGSLEHPVVIRIQAVPASFTSVTEVEATLKLTNVLNETNELTIPVKIRICPKRFYLEREGEEMTTILALPNVSELREDDGTSVVNDWVALWNPSHLTEAVIEAQIVPNNAAEASLAMVFRSTGMTVPSSFVVKPQERVGIRVILRLERGCSLRGDQIDFGGIKFICNKEEKLLKMVGRISPSIPLWRCSAAPERPVLSREEEFTITLTNDTKLAFQVRCVITNPESSSYGKVCALVSSVVRTGEGDVVAERKANELTITMPPFGSVTFNMVTLRYDGKAKIKFISSHKDMQSIEFDLLVSQGSASGGAPQQLVEKQRPPMISGCTFVCEPGLYEIDAGLVSEVQSWTLTWQGESSSSNQDWFLVRGLSKNVAAATAEDWVSVKQQQQSGGAPIFEVELNPHPLTQMGGFVCAYLVFPRLGVVRIKMEVVMVLQLEDAASILSPPLPTASLGGGSSAGSTPTSTVSVFELSPSSQIVSGPLVAGRTRSFPFTLFNRHPKAPLVFQLNVVGVKGGLSAWFSLFGMAAEEHRRVTVNSASSCRLQLNLYVPAAGSQTEDFSDLEINVTCRQLRNSILILKVCLPLRGFKSAFSLSCASSVRVGEPITISCDNPEQQVVAVGPDWIKTSSTSAAAALPSSGLVRCRLTNGDTLTVTDCPWAGVLTFYNPREANDFMSVRVVPPNANNLNPSLQGASMWRDAIELEMVKICMASSQVTDLANVLFRELLELILTDAGGRGAGLVALFFKLQFGSGGSNITEDLLAQKEMFIKELKSVPESLLFNVSEL